MIKELKTNYFGFLTIAIMALSVSSGGYAESSLVSVSQLTQWIKLNSPINNTVVTVDGLDASISKCVHNCQLVKLSTTPFSDQGTVNIDFYTIGGCHGQLPLVFKDNLGTLSTQTGIYMLAIEGNYCAEQLAEIEVNYTNKGYLVDIHVNV